MSGPHNAHNFFHQELVQIIEAHKQCLLKVPHYKQAWECTKRCAWNDHVFWNLLARIRPLAVSVLRSAVAYQIARAHVQDCQNKHAHVDDWRSPTTGRTRFEQAVLTWEPAIAYFLLRNGAKPTVSLHQEVVSQCLKEHTPFEAVNCRHSRARSLFYIK